MLALRKLQEILQSHLLYSQGEIASYITEPVRGTAAERLAIYEDGYRFRLIEVLQKDYSVLQQYIGDEAFEAMCRAYIDAYPSRYFSVANFGQHFPVFLENTEPYASKPYLNELAAFLWALSTTIDAPNAPLLTTQTVASIVPEQWPHARFTLQPSAELLFAYWNILPIWQALIKDETPPEPQASTLPVACMVWRKELQPYYCPLTQEEARVFETIQKGFTFAEICQELLQSMPEEEVAAYVVNLLLRWLNDGLLSTVNV
jgi:hypothetical protein